MSQVPQNDRLAEPLRSLGDRLAQTPAAELALPAGPAAWRLGLLLLGSAALGGIAVAIWNRGLLSELRQLPKQYSLFPDEDEGIDL